jgi:hypothetical protein
MNITIKTYPDDWAAKCVSIAGQKYQPSNGTEGECFISNWCGNCARDKPMSEGKPFEECDDNELCDILSRSYHNINDPDYPTEWQYGSDGQPRCHAFVEVGQPIPAKDDHTSDMFSDTGKLAELDGQCGDCGGTRRKDGKPCPACSPTEDGPADGGGE